MMPTTSSLPRRVIVKKSSSSYHKNGITNTLTTELMYDPLQLSDYERQSEEYNHPTMKQKRRKSVFDDVDWVQSLSDKFKPAPHLAAAAAQKSKEAELKERADLKMAIKRIEEEKRNERLAKEEREKEELRKKVMEMTIWKAGQETENIRRKEENGRAEWMSEINGLRGEIIGMKEKEELEKVVRKARSEGIREGEEKIRKEKAFERELDERYLLCEKEREREDRYGGRDHRRYLPITAPSPLAAAPTFHLHLANTPPSQVSSISDLPHQRSPNHQHYPYSNNNSFLNAYYSSANQYGYGSNRYENFDNDAMRRRTVGRERDLMDRGFIMGEVRGLDERVHRVESRLGAGGSSRGMDIGMHGPGLGGRY